MKKWMKHYRRWLLPVCYGVFVLLWLGFGLGRLVADRLLPVQVLELADARPVNISATENGYVNDTGDGQLIFEGINTKVRTVWLQAGFGQPPGEMDAYFNRVAGQGFSPKNRAIGVPQQGGGYLYRLPAGTVGDLRVDTGILPGVEFGLQSVTLNPHLPAGHYFAVNLRVVLAFAFAPPLACCAIYTIIEVCLGLRRKAGRRATNKQTREA